MSLKVNGTIGVISLCVGLGLGYKLFANHAPLEPQIITKTDVKTKIVKVTDPSGKVTETTEQESKIDSKPLQLKKYGVGVYHDKSAFAEARLGNLPLFLIIQSDFKDDHKIGIKLEF